ncbi:hypothetical protein IE81DRAFT_16772 [Ceraceosorus guamensis]|uniref:Uncharacterized protein n=1 Tax=Ceraceosorus guamensis TaxID=1522189 RepID=A0A316VQU4_9BASI|nr:hypothetical protein IE81DRAFT_16772 [Ceraceosorus guamensis]PWN39584.1 hypothetical protein IE81DRAFT_16772 [Ceraceosorus guamensis]
MSQYDQRFSASSLAGPSNGSGRDANGSFDASHLDPNSQRSSPNNTRVEPGVHHASKQKPAQTALRSPFEEATVRTVPQPRDTMSTYSRASIAQSLDDEVLASRAPASQRTPHPAEAGSGFFDRDSTLGDDPRSRRAPSTSETLRSTGANYDLPRSSLAGHSQASQTSGIGPRGNPLNVRDFAMGPYDSRTRVAPAAHDIHGSADRTRVYGLARDLRGVSPDSAHLPLSMGGSDYGSHPTAAGAVVGQSATSVASNGFSVEIFAPSFDHRGYPIYSGRAAMIRGRIRMHASESCEVIVKLWAYTSQGSPAAIWDGIALLPPDQGSETRVFEVSDTVKPDAPGARLRPRPAAPGEQPSDHFPATDDLVLELPFETQMPQGTATRWRDGETQVVPVAMPPSFEMSSESDAKKRADDRATEKEMAERLKHGTLTSSAASIRSKMTLGFGSGGGSVANSVREALEKGFGEVYRIGCFYSLSFTLQRQGDSEKESKFGKLVGKKVKKEKRPYDTITIPFLFLGEPSGLRLPPQSLPDALPSEMFFRANTRIAEEWIIAQATAKWSGSLIRTAKRSVELELHMYGIEGQPPVLHAPSAFPILIVIRPNDPHLLPRPKESTNSPSMSISASWNSAAGSPVPSHTHSPGASIQGMPLPPPASGLSSSIHDALGEQQERIEDVESTSNNGLVSRFMRSSLNLTRAPSGHSSAQNPMPTSRSSASIASPSTGASGHRSSTSKQITKQRSTASLASAFGKRRPYTAPTSSRGSLSPPGSSTVVPERSDGLDLAKLVRVSLLQTTYCTATGPSDVPRVRRKVISLAEVEEIDPATVVGGPTSPPLDLGLGEGETTGAAASRALIAHAKTTGVRVLRGVIKVSGDTTPGFRCQGIEVKYALKIDLLPFSAKHSNKRPASGGAGTTASISDALRSISETARPSFSSRREASQSYFDRRNPSDSDPNSTPRTPPNHPRSSHLAGGQAASPPLPPLPPQHRGSPGTLGSPQMSDIRSYVGGSGQSHAVGDSVYG